MNKIQRHAATTEHQQIEMVDCLTDVIGGGLATDATNTRTRQIMASVQHIDSVLYIFEIEGEVAGLLTVQTEDDEQIGFGQVETWPEATIWVSGMQCRIVRR